MSREHWLLLGSFLTAISVQLTAIEYWQDAAKPAWIAGLIAQVGILIRSFYTPKAGA